MYTYTYNKIITHLLDLDTYVKASISSIQGLNYNTVSNVISVLTTSALSEAELNTLGGLINSYINPVTVKTVTDIVHYAVNTTYCNCQEYSLVGNFIYNPENYYIDKISILPYSPVALEGTWGFKIYNSSNFTTIYESTEINNLDIQTLNNDVLISNQLSILEIHVKTSSPNSKIKISYISIARFINE